MMDDKLGTNWVAPGAGSRPSEIYAALPHRILRYIDPHSPEADPRIMAAETKLAKLAQNGDERTNLLLTGRPMQDHDWDRVISMVVSKRMLSDASASARSCSAGTKQRLIAGR